MSKKRGEYATGNRTALLTEAMDKLLAREGKDALKDFDGVFFIYAGDRFPAARGSLYWPHRASVTHNGKRWPYFICPEGGAARWRTSACSATSSATCSACPISTPGPRTPAWKVSASGAPWPTQVDNGRPQHFCAWSKEKLGWIKPAVIDPTVKQKLILAPDRRLAEGMLQGAVPTRRQRVSPAGKPPEEGLRQEPARRAAC